MNSTFLVSFFGRVQGVGVRALVLSEANKRGVFGWVRNSSKRDLVEACFFGEKKAVLELIDFLSSGKQNGFIRVDNTVVEELKESGEIFSDFQIKY